MTADKDIGRLEGKMDMLVSQMGVIHGKLDMILQGDCPTGAVNRVEIAKQTIAIRDANERIDKIDRVLNKVIIIGLAAASGGAGLVKFVEVLFA